MVQSTPKQEVAAKHIPFNKPCLLGNELRYVTEAITNGYTSGDGPFTKRCQGLLESRVGAAKVLLTTSCTHALEMAALLLDIAPGDEVIVPSFTFVSTINAFVLRGAVPVFIDIRPDTLNMDDRQLDRLITARTKAIIPVHYAGVGCEMESILAIASRHGVSVVEDNAHGLFGKYRGKYLGSFGVMATQSFHETKNFSCGEGGALVVNDGRYVERAEMIREKGTNRSRFFRGQVDKYTWTDVGSSYCPSDLLAAFLLAQLENEVTVFESRRRVWRTYEAGLRHWAAERGVGLPYIPEHCEQSYHMFYVVMPSLASRQALIEHLKKRGILAVFHYVPLHLSEMARRTGAPPSECPMTESISDRLVRLPLYNDLAEEDQAFIIDAVRRFPS